MVYMEFACMMNLGYGLFSDLLLGMGGIYLEAFLALKVEEDLKEDLLELGVWKIWMRGV